LLLLLLRNFILFLKKNIQLPAIARVQQKWQVQMATIDLDEDRSLEQLILSQLYSTMPLLLVLRNRCATNDDDKRERKAKKK
jgi:uncharacterized protein YueI